MFFPQLVFLKMQKKIDVLVIGAGPIGIACALACKKNNLEYVVLEKGALTNSLFHYLT